MLRKIISLLLLTSEWELKKAVVGFKLIEVTHSGINIAEIIAGVLRD